MKEKTNNGEVQERRGRRGVEWEGYEASESYDEGKMWISGSFVFKFQTLAMLEA